MLCPKMNLLHLQAASLADATEATKCIQFISVSIVTQLTSRLLSRSSFYELTVSTHVLIVLSDAIHAVYFLYF